MKWVIASVEQVYSHAVALGGVGEGVGVVKALDVACGTGIFARALAKLPGVVV
jgi:ubiquinone/menaquinone biosynthesis C-methylase UbiE